MGRETLINTHNPRKDMGIFSRTEGISTIKEYKAKISATERDLEKEKRYIETIDAEFKDIEHMFHSILLGNKTFWETTQLKTKLKTELTLTHEQMDQLTKAMKTASTLCKDIVHNSDKLCQLNTAIRNAMALLIQVRRKTFPITSGKIPEENDRVQRLNIAEQAILQEIHFLEAIIPAIIRKLNEFSTLLDELSSKATYTNELKDAQTEYAKVRATSEPNTENKFIRAKQILTDIESDLYQIRHKPERIMNLLKAALEDLEYLEQIHSKAA